VLGVGIDSGGSRTSYALDAGDGPLESSGNEAGSSIADARDTAAMMAAVNWIMDVIESQDDDEMCVWISAAGFSAPTASAIKAHFEPRIRALAARCEEDDRQVDIFIANDAVGLLKAPPLNGAGVAAIVGTGSVVMGAHPSCDEGVIKRGGYEWLVSDEGAGVWMTLQSIRLILRDIEERGARDYRSALLDRLADYVGIGEHELVEIPVTHRALAKADAVARKMSESRPDAKRFYARFVYPHIFDLVSLESGKAHDRIAADVVNQSVSVIVENIRIVSERLAAYTADEPNLRQGMPLIIGGNIAANPLYDQRLRVQLAASCRYISSVEAIGSAAQNLAALAAGYLKQNDRGRRQITKSFDPLHPVLRLL
jgi:N-acetylglucosamine kinase-like BadF-type ATPase